MRCSNCHTGEMRPGHVEQYDARALFGLEQPVVLAAAPALVCSVCQAVMLEGPVIEAAEQALLRQLVEQAGQLRPREIRFLRGMLGQPPSQLADRLGTDAATLRRWESGEASGPSAVSWSLRRAGGLATGAAAARARGGAVGALAARAAPDRAALLPPRSAG